MDQLKMNDISFPVKIVPDDVRGERGQKTIEGKLLFCMRKNTIDKDAGLAIRVIHNFWSVHVRAVYIHARIDAHLTQRIKQQIAIELLPYQVFGRDIENLQSALSIVCRNVCEEIRGSKSTRARSLAFVTKVCLNIKSSIKFSIPFFNNRTSSVSTT